MITKTIANYLLPLLTRFIDFLTIVIAGYIAIELRFPEHSLPNTYYYLLIILAALLFVLISNKLYSSWRGRSVYQLLFFILGYWFLSQAILLGIIFYSQSGILFSRIWLASWTIIALISLVTIRVFIYFALRRIRFKGRNLKHIGIIGDGYLQSNLIQQIQEQDDSGFQVAKVVGFDDMNEIRKMADLNLNEIWITFDINRGDKVHLTLEALSNSPATIRIAPDLYTYRLINHNITEILGFPMFDITSTP